MNYQVGQVLYTCNEKSLKIIPLQVVEVVVRTTLEGEKKEFIVQLPDTEQTTAPISAIKGHIFDNIDNIRTHLITNATNAIEKMIGLASELVKEQFNLPEKKEKAENQIEKRVQVETKNDIIMVDLGNGTKAKMNTSSLEKVVNQ